MTSHYFKASIFLALLGGFSVAYADSSGANAAVKSPNKSPATDGLLQRIEQRSGRTLTADERQNATGAIRTMVEGLNPPREKFVSEISRISGVSEARVWEMMPRIGGPLNQDKNMIPKLEEAMRRKLTNEELTAVRTADQQKKTAIREIRQTFAQAVSKVTGVPAEDLLAMLPKVGI